MFFVFSIDLQIEQSLGAGVFYFHCGGRDKENK